MSIIPLKPVEVLRRDALSAQPPKQSEELNEPDLVELIQLDSSFRLDIRYAKTQNFLGVALYTQERAFLQRPAAESLVRVSRSLAKHGYGLLIHDAYRPWYITKMFWDAVPEEYHGIFFANPATGSWHNRGGSVDVTLYEISTGKPVWMGGEYDEFSPRSYYDYTEISSDVKERRILLRSAMENEGFEALEEEWWHFDHICSSHYPVLNLKFEEIN